MSPPRFALWDVIVDARDGRPLLVIGMSKTEIECLTDRGASVERAPGDPELRRALPGEVPACWQRAPAATGPSAEDVRACLETTRDVMRMWPDPASKSGLPLRWDIDSIPDFARTLAVKLAAPFPGRRGQSSADRAGRGRV